MNYARLNFLQLDRLDQARLSWGALCYEIARDGGAGMHFDNDDHRRLVEWLRVPERAQGLADVAEAIRRGLEAADDAESIPLLLESLIGTAQVLSPVAVKAVAAMLNGVDERRLLALLEQAALSQGAVAGTVGRLSESIRGLIDFYRRAAARGQYLLIAELAH